MCCNWTVKFFELNANHSLQAAHLLLQNQKPYLFCFFHSAMCILLNNHGYSLVCKYINVCLINDYVIVLFFEQIKMLYILYNEFTWFFLLRKYEHSYDIIRYQPNAYSITVGFFFFKWSSTLRYLVFEPDGDDYDDLMMMMMISIVIHIDSEMFCY